MKSILLYSFLLLIASGCSKANTDVKSPMIVSQERKVTLFPDMPTIDRIVYENIRKTCSERWVMENMKMDTFIVKPDHGEYLIECIGIYEGELRRCVIRADAKGKWINDGMEKIKP